MVAILEDRAFERLRHLRTFHSADSTSNQSSLDTAEVLIKNLMEIAFPASRCGKRALAIEPSLKPPPKLGGGDAEGLFELVGLL
jgi:hypothetical protein